MKSPAVLVLTRADVAALLDVASCIPAVEEAFRLHAEGRSLGPASLGVTTENGGFHVKAAGLRLASPVFAAKVNANIPGNPLRSGLPTIQGVIVLADASSGSPLAVMDSTEITALRTAAATAVAARHLARRDARVAALCGCGRQGREQLKALAAVFRLEGVRVCDLDPRRAAAFASEMTRELDLPVEAVATPREAAFSSDVCVTCTPSCAPLLGPGDVKPGAFLAAVGSDSPEKQELDPRLLASSTLVVDVLEQCAEIGELHHALASGLLTRGDVHAELSAVVAGRRPGRRTPEEVIVFDSTGTALQDVAAARLVYDRATAADRGLRVELLS